MSGMMYRISCLRCGMSGMRGTSSDILYPVLDVLYPVAGCLVQCVGCL